MSENRTARSGAVAQALGMSAASVQAYARAGRIPFRLTPGGHYRFDVTEVVEVLSPAALDVRDDLVDLDRTPAVVVDDLSGYRLDPITTEAESRLRTRGHHQVRRQVAVPLEESQGAAELNSLISRAGGAAVAVLHR